jgi:exosortase/archaeosortase family protein
MELNTKIFSQERYLIPIKMICVYLVWKVFHYFTYFPGTALNHFWNNFVFRLGSIYASITSHILSVFGMYASADGININLLASHRQIWVQDHCVAIPVMVIFIGSVIFFKGEWRDKVKFLAVGLAGIFCINIIRLIFVCIAWVYLTPYFFNLHHSFIYVVATYGFVFFMITRWMNHIIAKSKLHENL